MKDLISIIVPVYKVEEYIEKCVRSIIAQTYKNLEIILVDDGSPDRCGEICDNFAKQDTRIKVVHKENGGLSDARNAGLDIASGNYIAFVDSDDWIDPRMYQKMLESIHHYQANLAICCIEKHWQLAGTSTIQDIGETRIYSRQKVLYELIKDADVSNYAWNKLYHRDLFKGIRYPKGRIFEDILLTYKLTDRVTRAVHLNDPLYHYLRRDDSIVGSYSAFMHLEACIARQEQYICVSKQHPELIPVLCKRYMSSFWDFKKKFMDGTKKEAISCTARITKEILPFFWRNRKELCANNGIGFVKQINTVLWLAFPRIYKVTYPYLRVLKRK